MRIRIFTVMVLSIASTFTFGQLTGTKTIPGSYSSVHNAIVALNQQGVGAGGVTFEIAAGYSEVFPAANSGLITTSGTAANPIVFKKNGAGPNPSITGYSESATNFDYVIALQGSDYITFNNLDITAWGNLQEWGFAVLKESGINGAQHVTISNCTILMDMSNVRSIGIYSENVTPSSPSTQLTVTSPDGTNSSNSFYNNFILNSYSGIKVIGYNSSAPYTFYDRENDIGSNGGNTIQNLGGMDLPASGIFTKYQQLLNVKNNLVTGFAEGSGEFSGIQISTANDASANISYNNVSIQYNGIGDFYGILNDMGMSNSGNTINLNNNTVTGCTYYTPGSKLCYYINNRAFGQTTNIFNNTITNNVYGTDGTIATGYVRYLQARGLDPVIKGEINVYGNLVSGNCRRSQPTESTVLTYYITVGAESNELNVYNNIVSNDSVLTYGYTYGLEILSQSNIKKIYGNTITNLLASNGPIYGIYTGQGGECSIYRNRIQNLKSDGPKAYAHGIYASSLGISGNQYIYNNLVGELQTPQVSNANEPAIIGIYLGGPNVLYNGCFNNTVFLDAATTGSTFYTAGIYMGIYGKSFDIRNNICINKSVPTGDGKTMALGGAPDTYKILSDLSNNNNFYAGVPSANRLIYFDGVNAAQTLQEYQSHIWPRESKSISEPTTFVNASNSPYDLHVDANVPTETESNATIMTTPVAIVTDFENQPRFPDTGYPVHPGYPAIAPDMGADEFGGVPDDKTPPAILIDPLSNTSELGNRTLIAVISDAHGVPVTGSGLPRICWQRHYNGAWVYETGQSLGNNQYKFEFGGGVGVGDTIRYFVVAQDAWSSPNVGSYPFIGATGFSFSPPACATPPSTPLFYVIVNPVCGSFNVGLNQTYVTLTAAINDLKLKHMTCPVTLVLTDNQYPSESYPVIIPEIPGSSPVNKLTIKPAPGIFPSFQAFVPGTTAPLMAMFSLVGAKHVIIDGSNSGGTDRSMTIHNQANPYLGWAAAIGIYSTDNSPAMDIVIKNCIIRAYQDTIRNTQGISCYPMAGQPGFRDIEIRNNEINTAKSGILLGGERANRCRNIRIIDNKVGSMIAGQYVVNLAMTFDNIDTLLVEGNEVIGFVTGTNPTTSILALKFNTGLSNVKVSRNIIHDVYHIGIDAVGLYFDTRDNSTVTEVSNNLIYNIKAPGTNLSINGSNPCGIFVWSGKNYKIHHNTIHMKGNVLASGYQTLSACVGFGGNGSSNILTNIDLRNNIFINSMVNAQGLPGNKTYAVITNSPNCFSSIDNNDYYLDGTGPLIGFLNGDKASLSNWQGATGQDQNSKTLNPLFASAMDFHPTNSQMNNKGVYVADVPHDFNLNLRTNPPDMGIYEFGADPAVVTTGSSMVTTGSATLEGTIMANNEFVSSHFDYGTTTAYTSTMGATPSQVTGLGTANISLNISSLSPGTTYHFRARGVASTGLIIYGEDQTFTTTNIPENILLTGSVIDSDTCYNATNTITVAGGNTIFEIQGGSSVTMIAGQKIAFLVGTKVYPGGYLHGYISTGTYCEGTDAPYAPVLSNLESYETNPFTGNDQDFILFPNPTHGNFTLVQKSVSNQREIMVEVFNMHGRQVMSEKMSGQSAHRFSIEQMPSGMYLVKITVDEKVMVLKMAKL